MARMVCIEYGILSEGKAQGLVMANMQKALMQEYKKERRKKAKRTAHLRSAVDFKEGCPELWSQAAPLHTVTAPSMGLRKMCVSHLALSKNAQKPALCLSMLDTAPGEGLGRSRIWGFP